MVKRALITLLILIVFLTPVHAQSEDFQKSLKKIESSAKKLNELIEKYKEKKLPVVKHEAVTITDQNGNGVSCTMETYYSDYQVSKITTGSNGKYSGNVDHGNHWPADVISFRLIDCPCRVTGTTHETTFPQFDEHINRIKSVMNDEVSDWLKEKAQDQAKNAVERAFSAAGAGRLAGPFLAGFSAGAELGAPVGEFITSKINDILEEQLRWRQLEHELGDSIVPRGLARLNPRALQGVPLLGGALEYFRTDPVIKNTWNIQVRCAKNIKPIGDISSGWEDYDQYRPQPEPIDYGPSEEEQERRDEEQRKREEKQKREQERREREREEQRKREEAKRQYEERMRQLRERAEEIKRTCPLCDEIRKEIATLDENIKNKAQEIPGLETALANAQNALDQANRNVRRASERLHDFQTPDSYVEDPRTGERITSTDLEIQRELARQNWQRYRQGEQTAEETVENWEEQSAPEAHEAAKKAAEERLKKAVENAEKAKQTAEKELSAAKQRLQNAKNALERMQQQRDELAKKLEECLKLCKKYAMDIAKGWIQDYRDLFAKEENTQTTAQPPQPSSSEKSGPCARYEEIINTATRGRISVSDYESLSAEARKEFVSPAYQKAINEAKENCNKEKGVLVSEQPQKYVTQPPSQQEQPKTCKQVCDARGMTSNQPDWTNYILGELNSQGVCKKRASINYGTIVTSGNCQCYPTSKPEISISQEHLICQGTVCGDVACGDSAECSCGENCRATVECSWGGWKQQGTQYIPTAGTQTSQ